MHPLTIDRTGTQGQGPDWIRRIILDPEPGGDRGGREGHQEAGRHYAYVIQSLGEDEGNDPDLRGE